MNEPRITLTGVDRRCAVQPLLALAREFPNAEWAFLYSPGRVDQGRYGAPQWIRHMTERLRAQGSATAVHLCDESVDHFLQQREEIVRMVEYTSRVQINFNQQTKPRDLFAMDMAIRAFARPVITPHNAANAEVATQMLAPNHQVLFDASGGRGESPAEWSAPLPGKECGHAGGIGPENIVATLDAVSYAAGFHSWWVDMETHVRDEQDAFCLQRSRSVLEQAAWWHSEQASLAPSMG